VKRINSYGIGVVGPVWGTGAFNEDDFAFMRANKWFGVRYLGMQAYWADAGFTPYNALRWVAYWKPGDPKIIITECGRDKVRDGDGGTIIGNGGWQRDGLSAEQFRAECVSFDANNSFRGSPVAGALLFTAGPSHDDRNPDVDWRPYSVDEITPIVSAPTGSIEVVQTVTRIGRVLGFDVSNNNGVVDWTVAGDAGFAFAFIKRSEGTNFLDATFETNWKGARDAGLVRGAYHFGRPSANSGHAEATCFVDAVKDWQAGDIAVLDLEDDRVAAGAGLGDYTVDFCETVKALLGFAPMIYTGAYYLTEHGMIGDNRLGNYGLWIASYQSTPPSAPAPWPFWAVWQFSGTGTVPGILGAVDLDLYNGTRDTLVKYGKP
jgi:GH25 family lysozyme M1 (1,4-beta-N-acetylmuramidase)